MRQILARIPNDAKQHYSLSRGLTLRTVLILLLGVVFSFALFLSVQSSEQQHVLNEYVDQVKNLSNAFGQGLEIELDELRALRAINATGQLMNRVQFREYVSETFRLHPEIQGMSWDPVVESAQRSEYEQAAKSEGMTNFVFLERDAEQRLVPAQERPEYVIVYFIEPMDGNSGALGYDVLSDPIRRAAVERARDTGQMAATARVALVQETADQTGVLVFRPVYRNGIDVTDSRARRDSLLGFVVAVLRIGPMTDGVLRDHSRQGIALSLYDVTDANGGSLLYSDNVAVAKDRSLEQTGSFELAGRRWSLVLSPTAATADRIYQIFPEAWLSLFGGLLSTALLLSFFVSSVRHAGEMQRVAQALHDSEEHFRTVAESANEAIITFDLFGKIVFWNHAAETMFGYSPTEASSKTMQLIVPERFLMGNDPGLVREADTAVDGSKELRAKRKDGTELLVELSLSSWRTAHGVFLTAILRDITERKRAEEHLRYLGTHDVLTGLYNRTFFEEELARFELSRDYPISVVMVDLDGLKITNDREGHSAGDELIRRAARLLASSFRSGDVVARIGGDEFAVLLPSTDAETTIQILQRLAENLVVESRSNVSKMLSFSVGSATAVSGPGLDATVREADQKMYLDKAERHRDKVVGL